MPGPTEGLVEEADDGVDGLGVSCCGVRGEPLHDGVELLLGELAEAEPEALTGREVRERRFPFALLLSLTTLFQPVPALGNHRRPRPSRPGLGRQ